MASSSRSKLFSFFHHKFLTTSSKTPPFQNPKFHHKKISNISPNQPLLFNKTQTILHKNPNFTKTQMRFFYKKSYYYNKYSNTLKNYLISKGKWGSFIWEHKVKFSIVCSSLLVYFYVGNWETIPYSKRLHFVPISHAFEDWVAKDTLEDYKHKYKLMVLDEKNPKSQRVFKITKDILRALNQDLELEKGSIPLSYANVDTPTKEKLSREVKPWLVRYRERKEGIHHLFGLHWEVMLINNVYRVNAYCVPDGKVVLFTGLLRLCDSDDEIAACIAHEVGHVVGRHTSESLMMFILYFFAILMCFPFLPLVLDDDASFLRRIIVDYPISRRREVEADHIGLILMALAGYDPRKAPGFYEKLEKDDVDFNRGHPSGKKRAKILRDKRMEEAVKIYKVKNQKLEMDTAPEKLM